MTEQKVAVPVPADDLRTLATTRLRKKRDLQAHALAYVLVNIFFMGIWWVTMPGGFFWPIFPMLGWGIGLGFHIWDVYAGSDPSEEAIQAEIERMSRR